eukprot:gb/GECH01003096.1/.p1 GENE.gb/GECH01003096.1/~~gb/GECH01003096.1/.p1  ORF type:complete len:1011 (+),score=316.35 gb/GECH01003096.1/:1-3033(+)
MDNSTINEVLRISRSTLIEHVLNPRSSNFSLLLYRRGSPIIFEDTNQILYRMGFTKHVLLQQCKGSPHYDSHNIHPEEYGTQAKHNRIQQKNSLSQKITSICYNFPLSMCQSIAFSLTGAYIRNKITDSITEHLSSPYGLSSTAASLITVALLFPAKKAYHRLLCIESDPTLVFTVHSKASKEVLGNDYNDADFQKGIFNGICSMMSKEKIFTLYRGLAPSLIAEGIRSIPTVFASQSNLFFLIARFLAYPFDTLSIILQMERFPELKYMFRTQNRRRQLLDNMEQKYFEEAEEEEEEEEDETEDGQENENGEKKGKKKSTEERIGGEYEPFTEDMYVMRKPHKNYRIQNEVEKKVKRAKSKYLKTFVVFAGLLYGKEEDIFHSLFKQAWDGYPESLQTFVGKGENFVPMIHVEDLASIVYHMLSEPPEEPKCILAVDDAQSTWKTIISALSDTLGTGKIEHSSPQESLLTENAELFSIDVKFQKETVESFDFEWVSKDGFVANIKTIVHEFLKSRNLTPLKVCLLGPPASGKTSVGSELSKKYKISHIKIDNVIQEYFQNEDKLKEEYKTLGKKIYLKEKEKEKQEAEEEMENEKENENEEGNEDENEKENEEDTEETENNSEIDNGEDHENPETDEAEQENNAPSQEDDLDDEQFEFKPEETDEEEEEEEENEEEGEEEGEEELSELDKLKRQHKDIKKQLKRYLETSRKKNEDDRYNDDAITRMYKWKLSLLPQRNKGWVLDGFPKTQLQASKLFEKTQEEEDEEEDEDGDEENDGTKDSGKLPKANEKAPEYVPVLSAEKEDLEKRLAEVPSDKLTPHLVPEAFERRYTSWKEHNSSHDAEHSVITYLEGMRIGKNKEVIAREFNAMREIPQILQDISEMIGEPHNYGPTKEEIRAREKKEAEKQEEERRIQEEKEEEERKRKEIEEFEKQEQKQKEEEQWKEIVKQEKEMLEVRSAPLREYLMENVIPHLTQGLIETVRQQPEDPVDFLAEWMFTHNPNNQSQNN